MANGITIDATIPLWSVIVGLITVVGACIKLYIDYARIRSRVTELEIELKAIEVILDKMRDSSEKTSKEATNSFGTINEKLVKMNVLLELILTGKVNGIQNSKINGD